MQGKTRLCFSLSSLPAVEATRIHIPRWRLPFHPIGALCYGDSLRAGEETRAEALSTMGFGYEETVEMRVAPRSPNGPVEGDGRVARKIALMLGDEEADRLTRAKDEGFELTLRQCRRAAFERGMCPDQVVESWYVFLRGLADGAAHSAASVVSSNPSSSHPVIPPAMIFTGRPSSARRKAPRAAPLQWGPAQ